MPRSVQYMSINTTCDIDKFSSSQLCDLGKPNICSDYYYCLFMLLLFNNKYQL